MDTAIALNAHGGTSQGQGGQSGNFGALAYHAMMGPLEMDMYAATDNSQMMLLILTEELLYRCNS